MRFAFAIVSLAFPCVPGFLKIARNACQGTAGHGRDETFLAVVRKMSDTLNGYGALRRVLEEHCTAEGCSLKDLTVLSKKADPYRLDIPTGHRDGAWVAAQLDRLLGDRRIHLRGLHYAIVVTGDTVKPDGSIYRNTEDDWLWLSQTAGKSARWLGYIPFDRIFDNRNAAPVINRKAKEHPGAF